MSLPLLLMRRRVRANNALLVFSITSNLFASQQLASSLIPPKHRLLGGYQNSHKEQGTSGVGSLVLYRAREGGPYVYYSHVIAMGSLVSFIFPDSI
ncbi:hypothetical protein F5X96DRAFT_396528 [Biscogniauxia mediterranea]|nr:hypothetical protein F5X96DRAFT_396528 [Biscogniauxia mediterranea]